jgi:hypothetical protein
MPTNRRAARAARHDRRVVLGRPGVHALRNLAIDWATGSNQPTTLTFDPVRSSQLRLDTTSAAPGTGDGFLMIAELQPRSGGVKIG